jgi:hypothetical protein
MMMAMIDDGVMVLDDGWSDAVNSHGWYRNDRSWSGNHGMDDGGVISLS